MDQLEEINQRLTTLTAEVTKLRRRFFWSVVIDGLRLLLLIVPIMLAVIYLPPFLKPYIAALGELMANLPN